MSVEHFCFSPEPVEYQMTKGTLRGLRWGNPEAPIVLALHGWLDNAQSFTPLLQQSRLTNKQVIALDLPGHGLSDHYPAGFCYSLSDYVLDISQFISTFDHHSIILMGHSLGGIIASFCAAGQPDKVLKLILLDALGPMVNDEKQILAHFQKAIDQACHTDHRPKIRYSKVEEAVRARMKGIGNISKASSELLVSRGLLQVENGYVWRSDPSLRKLTPIRLDESQTRQLLMGIICPTLLLCASQGYVSVDIKKNPRLAYIPSLRIEKVEGGHHFHMEGDINSTRQAIEDFWV